MGISTWSAALTACLLLAAGESLTITERFKGPRLGAAWSLSSKSWQLQSGKLVGKGSGHIQYGSALSGDFSLSFEAQTREKANIEVQLVDSGGNAVYTFAFLGRYHRALDGVKCCILKQNQFVNVDSRHWIFPGRTFRFEVRRAKNQYQMFLDRELAPFFVDEAPVKGVDSLKLRIIYDPEGKKDKLELDNIELTLQT